MNYRILINMHAIRSQIEIPSDDFAAFIFDCDGTLADSMPLHYKAWCVALKSHDVHFPEDLFYEFGGMPSQRIIEILNERHQKNMPVEDVANRKEIIFEELLSEVSPIEPVVEIVHKLHGKKPMAVVSGGNKQAVVKTLSVLGILEKFDKIITSEDYQNGKPHPDPFLKASQGLGIPPSKCFVYEDTLIGIKAASAAGMKAALVPSYPERKQSISTKYTIGIDLGGTHVKALALSPEGKLLSKLTCDTGDMGDGAWKETVKSILHRLQDERGHVAQWVGLAAPGLPARDHRSILSMPGRMRGLENFEWDRFLKTSQPVNVINDSQSALLGEAWIGAARGMKNVILLTLGTGVGGGAIVDGKLLRGTIGRAGNFGHLSLNPNGLLDIVKTPGSLEDAIGNCTIRARSQGRFSSNHELVQAYREGDPLATRVWLQALKDLAAGLTSLINILDPEFIVLGGGLIKAGDDLFKPLETFLREIEWSPAGHRVKVVPAELGEWAGAYGAAWMSMQNNATL